jgi:hypothetical protein
VKGECVKQDHVMLDELDGHVTIRIDDWELFDFIDDQLDSHDLSYDFYSEQKSGCCHFFVMHFQSGVDYARLKEVIDSIDPQEIQRIWELNN